ncbi:C-type lectin domain family 2 member D-like [Mauremys reevesii]|uniref:C-type lectin domain family 2 member D-like n=1 Tax=Mauremys reevesii TaxID=260615 RepID=UPI00193F9D41|nr:C-type lectin domain family 2 member D-like [Mauremys reevesii]
MGPAAGAAESEEPLQRVSCIGCSGHQKICREPEPCRNCKTHKARTIIVAVVLTSVILVLIACLAVPRPKLQSTDRGPPAVPCCPDGWVGYRGKCYYFSETEGNWTYSRSNCSSLGASLAGIDSEQEMMFLLRYKGVHDHWIGLQKEQGQPWKWTNGTEFNRLFRIRGGSDCAYLNDEKGVSNSRCYMERRWICSKPEVYVMGKGTHWKGAQNKPPRNNKECGGT